ncbi:hypothetical protein DH2020_040485 [Rehmannia glutinosa]|uniref:Late embryogenesis abundant protein LEA-2 subgroup domain-containing protein n=1 Tax=Rehmannia glutinosa TaxID=99300 RepID=A0ABR0UU14_REHGL
MEERLPPSDPTKDDRPPLPPPPAAAADLETYVVQIPRDQIYRVPPPEHARIYEHYHKRTSPNNHKTTTCRKTLCWAAAVPILLIAAAVIAVLAIRATLYNPTSPEFSVAAIQARNLDQPVKDHRHLPEFDVTLRAGNPNPRLFVSYKEGGEASLVFKNQKIGQGQILSTVEQPPNGGSADFPVVLYGNGPPPLSPEIKKSLIDGATEKSMVVTIEVPMEINSWVRNERKDIKISCNFRVKNSLMNKTKISSQECRTEF